MQFCQFVQFSSDVLSIVTSFTTEDNEVMGANIVCLGNA